MPKSMKINVTFDGECQNETIKKAIIAALEFENVTFDCEVEVVIVDTDEIRQLNYETRGIDRVTDVLSFPMFENINDVEKDTDELAFLGSVVICKQRAIEQAEEYGHSIQREAAFLAVHSILHLLGYDHETSKEDEVEMFDKQEQILTKIGITR